MTQIGYHDGIHPLNNCCALFLEVGRVHNTITR